MLVFGGCAGAYTFFTESDDCSEVWVAPHPVSMQDLRRMVAACHQEEQGYLAVQWIEGKSYYIRALLKEHSGLPRCG